MRALKILVVVMGVMLVVGFTALVVVIAGKVSRGGPATITARAFGSPSIDIPSDARIEAMTVGLDRLVVALALPEGSRQLLVIDLATGIRLGTIQLQPAP
jgi:hypothetical protein